MFEVQFKLEKSSNRPLYSIQRQRFIFKTIIFWTNHLSNTPCCNSHCKTLSLFFTLLPFLGLFHLKDCLQVRCRMTVDIWCRSLISLKKGGFAKARLKMYFQYRSATFWSKLNWAMRGCNMFTRKKGCISCRWDAILRSYMLVLKHYYCVASSIKER